MSERPIIFGADSVRAILACTKAQTRRVAKEFDGLDVDAIIRRFPNQGGCPYGAPGGHLWVREAWSFKAWSDADCLRMGVQDAPKHPSEDYLGVRMRAIPRASCSTTYGEAGPWRSPIYMPRWASRLTLEITGVKVERLQDITEEDARAEGIAEPMPIMGTAGYVAAYSYAWGRINGKRYPWTDSNPWVWCLSFRLLEPPIPHAVEGR